MQRNQQTKHGGQHEQQQAQLFGHVRRDRHSHGRRHCSEDCQDGIGASQVANPQKRCRANPVSLDCARDYWVPEKPSRGAAGAKPIVLTAQERADISEFLQALSGGS